MNPEVILQKLAFLFLELSPEAFFPAKHNKKPPPKIAPREELTIKKVVYFSFFHLIFLKNSAAISGSMVEISIPVESSNPAQTDVRGKSSICQ